MIASLFYAIVGLHCMHVLIACIFISIAVYFIMQHPLNYPTGVEYSRKTSPLFPRISECAKLLEE